MHGLEHKNEFSPSVESFGQAGHSGHASVWGQLVANGLSVDHNLTIAQNTCELHSQELIIHNREKTVRTTG